MASLNKLAIRGIRSFDDKHVQVIEFYSPLTVIVGHNGSGKTTIIECLKYATTGDLPPNTKGGAFVHDPKMANEKEVKAQVRLRFWNVNRQRMTATRNLQVTTKKTGALSMKTLEGLLAKTDADGGEGKRNTISTKCSEMDEEVPLLLGVSKAILENVIFCHQEESNWPLSEPAALKKKFDDIFEATKYTKALDNIKALRKERTAELKVDRERLKFLKADKDKAERMRRELEDAINKEQRKQTQVEELKTEFERLKEINVQHYAEATGFQRVFEQFETLKQRKAMLEDNRKHMLDGMTVMTETSDELQHMLSNFNAHVASIEAKRATQIDLREKEDSALEDLRRRERNLASTQGGLIANKRNFERNVRERESAIREVAKTHNFAGYDYSPLEDAKIAEFADKLHDLVRRAEADLRKLQADGARRERELQSELDRLAGSKTTAVATKKSKQEQIGKLNDKIRAAESTFDTVSSLDAEIEMLEANIARTEEQQAQLEAEIRELRFDEKIREKAVEIRQKEAERDKISAELSALNRQADSRAQLAIKRNEMGSKQGQVAASVASHGQRFKDLVGSDLEAETMEEKITVAIGRKDRELQEAEAAASASNRNISQLQTLLNIAKQSLKINSDEAKRLEEVLAEALGTDYTTIEEAMKVTDEEIVFRQNAIANREADTQFWRNILHVGKSRHKCHACDRGLSATEAKAMSKHVETQIQRLTSDAGMKEQQEELEQWQAEGDKFRNLLPSESTLKELKNKTIPSLEKQVADESAQLDSVQEEVEEAKAKLQRAKIAARDLQTLKGAATLVTRTLGEIKDLKSDIERLERELQSTGSLKTVEDVQQEVDQASNDIKNLQREQGSLQADKEGKANRLRSYGDEYSRQTLRLGQLKGQQERRQREEAALRELRETQAQLHAELKELDAAAQAAEAPWREKNEELNRSRTERANAENEAGLQVGLYQSSLSEVESKHRACQAYVVEGNDRKIREAEAQMESIRSEITASTTSRASIESVITELNTEIAKADSLKSNISANIRYRKEEKEIGKVQEEIEGIDIESAAKSRKEFNSVYKKNLEEETEYQNNWQLAKGELAQMVENRKKTERTLDSDYKNIDKQFKEQLIKTKASGASRSGRMLVSEFANNDLEKYGKALDNAILRYHSIKMDEINDTIGHLWNKTYQGTDIDGIRIVSDHDEATSTSTRKSYNYRVVMVKNDVELDMRGRCSAGQKVLASIIIRLALAESFGQGCGVLALDEPTTNLDQENINALAEALAEIIRERRRQANFQLIVITHDEGFLQRLAAHDVLEYYWRVSRDASQKSILERQRVGI